MARPNLITGQITIPSFQQSVGTNPTANLTSGSPNITNITNDDLLYVGLKVTNANLPANTTVVSVNYGANTAVLSNPATGTATGTTLTIVFADGQYFCSGATFIDVNGQYSNTDIEVGFQIVNQATDAGSFIALSGVFNLWKISHITNVVGDGTTLSFYVTFDEEAPYSATNHVPTDAIQNAITEQTALRDFGWNVSSQVYPNLPAGSDIAQTNLDTQNITDFIPIIIDPAGTQYSGSYYIQFTGSAVTDVSASVLNGLELLTITLEGGSGTAGTSGGSTTSGTSGTAGSAGTSGTGVAGTSGTSPAGSSGTSGTSGGIGSSGTSGTGVNGSSGTSGAAGSNGTSGTGGTGTSGTSGNDSFCFTGTYTFTSQTFFPSVNGRTTNSKDSATFGSDAGGVTSLSFTNIDLFNNNLSSELSQLSVGSTIQ